MVTIDELLGRVERLRQVTSLVASGEARGRRERAGLSQREVGEVVGVDRSEVVRWESGDRAPHGDRLSRYAALLDRLAEVRP